MNCWLRALRRVCLLNVEKFSTVDASTHMSLNHDAARASPCTKCTWGESTGAHVHLWLDLALHKSGGKMNNRGPSFYFMIKDQSIATTHTSECAVNAGLTLLVIYVGFTHTRCRNAWWKRCLTHRIDCFWVFFLVMMTQSKCCLQNLLKKGCLLCWSANWLIY